MTSEGRGTSRNKHTCATCEGPCQRCLDFAREQAGRVVSHYTIYTITVQAFDMTDDQIDALFDRVADAAHALDEQVTVGGGRLTPPASSPSS